MLLCLKGEMPVGHLEPRSQQHRGLTLCSPFHTLHPALRLRGACQDSPPSPGSAPSPAKPGRERALTPSVPGSRHTLLPLLWVLLRSWGPGRVIPPHQGPREAVFSPGGSALRDGVHSPRFPPSPPCHLPSPAVLHGLQLLASEEPRQLFTMDSFTLVNF